MPDTLQTAYDAALEGYAVFPIEPGSKVPTLPWRDVSTTDTQVIESAWPLDANIGIDCGKSGIVVVDVDVKHGPGLKEWRLLCEQYGDGDWPVTLTVRTASGGRHFYFEAGEHELRNSQGLLARNIDIRANGGYVVGWASVVDDRAYEIEYGDAPAELPGWIADLEQTLRARKTAVSAAKSETAGLSARMLTPVQVRAKLENLTAYLSSARAPGRNNLLFWVTHRLKPLIAVGRLPQDDVIATLVHACEINGLVGDDGESSVLATIRSALRGQ